MLIGEAADQVIAELGYMTSEKKLDRRNVIVRMDTVHRSLCMALAYDGTYMGQGEWRSKVDSEPTELPDILYVSRVAPVMYDKGRGQYYFIMPSEYVSFKNNNGVRWVAPLQDPTDGFICQKAGSSGAYYLLESSELGGMKGYEMEGLIVYLNNFPPNTFDELRITYLPALRGLKETDTLPMSGEMAKQLLDGTRDSFLIQLQKPQDFTQDTVSN